jgi:hypothetical protein
MRIRALKMLRGPEVCANPGTVLEVEAAFGAELVKLGAAAALDPVVEAATEEAPETATQPRPRGARGGRGAEG